MSRERPTIVLLVALGNLLLGMLCMLAGCGGLGNWLFAATRRPGAGGPNTYGTELDFVTAQVPACQLAELVNSAELLTASVCLALASFGLLWMAPWARWLALAYAVLTLCWQVLNVLAQVLWVWPALEAFFVERSLLHQAYASDEQWTLRLSLLAALILQTSVLGLHALALLIVLCWPSVGAAFAAPVPTDGPRQAPEIGLGEPRLASGG